MRAAEDVSGADTASPERDAAPDHDVLTMEVTPSLVAGTRGTYRIVVAATRSTTVAVTAHTRSREMTVVVRPARPLLVPGGGRVAFQLTVSATRRALPDSSHHVDVRALYAAAHVSVLQQATRQVSFIYRSPRGPRRLARSWRLRAAALVLLLMAVAVGVPALVRGHHHAPPGAPPRRHAMNAIGTRPSAPIPTVIRAWA